MLENSQRSEEEVILVDVAADAMHEGPNAPAVYQNVALNDGPGCSTDPNANGADGDSMGISVILSGTRVVCTW